MSKGGRNLIILGLLAMLVTVTTCGISLYIYHASGDIYIDRSRPGFLPDAEESASDSTNSYTFDESGLITNQVLDEYLENLTEQVNNLKNIENPYSSTPLSDEALGIPSN